MIPIQIPFKIRPDLINPLYESVLYTFSNNDIVEHAYDYTLYRVPHSPCTFWTNFRFTKEPGSELSIELMVITTDGTASSITKQEQPNAWHDTFWALPSIDTNNDAGFYFKIHYKNEPGHNPIGISLVGFIHLFPAQRIYHLLSEDGACQFIVTKQILSSYEKNESQPGTIHKMNLQEKEKVVEADTVSIRPISDYH